MIINTHKDGFEINIPYEHFIYLFLAIGAASDKNMKTVLAGDVYDGYIDSSFEYNGKELNCIYDAFIDAIEIYNETFLGKG